MPTFQHGKSTSVYLDEFDMSAYLQASDVGFDQDTADVTTYGASSRAFIASQASGTLSFNGLIDATDTAGTSDKEFEAILGSATHPVLTVAIEAARSATGRSSPERTRRATRWRHRSLT